MNLDMVLRLEEKIDRLLKRKSELEEDCRRLLAEREGFLAERERFRQELDRIIDRLGRESS